MNTKNINVVGVGYIGSVISVHLAGNGYEVLGIDKNEEVINKESWFSRYNDIDSCLNQEILDRIETTTSYSEIYSEVTIVCVNTPAGDNSANLSNLKNAVSDLGDNLVSGHTVILRSTVPPKTTDEVIIPLLEERSGLKYEEDFHLCYAPEFIRGGTGIEDFTNPSKTVISGDEEGKKIFRKIFPISANLHETSIATAEAIKYFDNVFHGLKISLANECGRIGQEIGIKPAKVMEVISSDDHLNASDMYMDPGKAFGGPCLYKDIKIIDDEAEIHNTNAPVISSINESNREHNLWIIEKIEERNPRSVGIIGAKYKEKFNSTDRSPSLTVASQLQNKISEVLVYDPDLELEEFNQADRKRIKKADLWVIFNSVNNIEEMKSEFQGDIVDLANFSF